MANLSTESGFVIVGAASGQIFASQVGGIGLVGSFGGLAVGTPVIVVSGALAGAALQGMIDGLESGDVTVLGVTTVGSVLGAGLAGSVGNVGVGIAGTAFGIGMGTMAIAGGIFAAGVYQLIKGLVKNGPAESFDELFDRMEDRISGQEFYSQALLDLDPLSQALTWHHKFSELDTDQELQALKQMLNLDASGDFPKTDPWQIIDKPAVLKDLICQLKNQSQDYPVKSLYPPSSQAENSHLITINLPNYNWQATELKHFENPAILSLTIANDGQHLYSANANGTIHQWDLKKRKHLSTFISGGEELLAVALAPDRQKLFAAGFEPFITAWHIPSGAISRGFRSLSLQCPTSHQGVVSCLACSPDGKILVSGGGDGIIKLWDAVNNTWQRNLNGHQGPIQAIAFSGDGQTLISGGEDCTIRLWSISDGKALRTLGNHPAKITALGLANQGQSLVSASLDGTVKIWDLNHHICLRSFQAHQGNLRGMAVNPVTNIIATATAQCVKLWDWETQHCTQLLDGSFPLNFGPNGQQLITVNPSPCKGLKVWQWQIKSDINSSPVGRSFDVCLPWWEVLNVCPDADRQTVKAAYYALAKQFHPDQNGDPQRQDRSIITMQQINHAYDQFQRQES